MVAATVDEAGWPHPSLLSVESVEAVSEQALRVTLVTTSRTWANLARDGKLTFAFVDPEMVYYLKTKADPETTIEGDGTVSFEAHVEDVLEDTPALHEAGSVIRTGITFRHDSPPGAR